jgi:hypothetical protein
MIHKNRIEDQTSPRRVGRYYIWPNGTVLPVVSGASDDGDGDGDGEDKSKKTYTQADLDNITAEVRRKAKGSAEKEILKLLDVEDVDSVKKVLEAHRSNQDKNKTDLEKAQGELGQEKTKRESTESTLAELDLTVRIEKALINKGLTVAAAERARGLVKLDTKATAEDIKAELETLEKEMPNLFTGLGNGEQGKTPPNSNPGTPPKGKPGQQGSSPQEAARAILHARHPKTAKQ